MVEVITVSDCVGNELKFSVEGNTKEEFQEDLAAAYKLVMSCGFDQTEIDKKLPEYSTLYNLGKKINRKLGFEAILTPRTPEIQKFVDDNTPEVGW